MRHVEVTTPPHSGSPPHPLAVMAFALEPLPVQTKPVTRISPVTGAVNDSTPAIIAVPPPSRVIYKGLGIVTGELQVQLPPGTSTWSPLDAELIAFCTSICE